MTRVAVAVILWAHAIFLFDVPRASLAPLFYRLHTSAGEVTVLALIAGFSVLTSYGWGNVAVDLIYVYFFPFICLYYLARRAVISLGSPAVNTGPTESSEPPPYYVQIPWPALIAPSPRVAKPVAEPASAEQINESLRNRVARHALRPFRHFTLLWCLLLLLTTHRWLLSAALVVVSVQLLVFLTGIALSFTSNGWLSKFSQAFQQESEKLIRTVTEANAEVTQEVRNAWVSLRVYLMGVYFLQDRRRAAQWAVFLGGVTFIIIYLYLALLFSFEYYGIARLERVPLAWGDALITSVFIPIAYSDLPHTKLLRLASGIQWACVVALGASTFFSIFRKKLEPLYAVANAITRKMEEEEVKTTLIVLKDKLTQPPPPPGHPLN